MPSDFQESYVILIFLHFIIYISSPRNIEQPRSCTDIDSNFSAYGFLASVTLDDSLDSRCWLDIWSLWVRAALSWRSLCLKIQNARHVTRLDENVNHRFPPFVPLPFLSVSLCQTLLPLSLFFGAPFSDSIPFQWLGPEFWRWMSRAGPPGGSRCAHTRLRLPPRINYYGVDQKSMATTKRVMERVVRFRTGAFVRV